MSKHLKSVQWLSDNLAHPDLILLDASNSPKLSIKGARFFDLKQTFCETDAVFPNTVPNAASFERGCQELGINQSSLIVVYDDKGVYTSPRVWWLFKTMGFKNIFVLNGGLPEWKSAGYGVEPLNSTPHEQGNFIASYQPQNVKIYKAVLSNLDENDFLVVDARSNGRFNGTEPEPRKTLQSGNIPNSINIPYSSVLENGKYKSNEALKAIFKIVETDTRPITFSCGSGITACIVLLAYASINECTTSVYDGSWTEWATLQGLLANTP